MKTVSTYPWRRALVWIGCATVVISGCASIPAPTTQLAVSKAAVADAVSAGAPEFAPFEMKTARDKLDRANLALAYGGFTYTQDTHEANLGPFSFTIKDRERVNIPVWAGAGAMVVGLILLFKHKLD